MTISIEMIRKRLETMNTKLHTDFELECRYGGYRIVNKEGSADVSPRLKKAELVQWLNGFFSCLYKQY